MSDEYTPRQPDEHRLMANMLRVLGGNRALADQVIAEVEDSLWLAEHDAEVARQQAERDAQILEHMENLPYELDVGETAVSNPPTRKVRTVVAAIRAQFANPSTTPKETR